jgi:hypothetical protein
MQKEETKINKVEQMVADLMVSMAIQEAINQQAITAIPEEVEAIRRMIAEIAEIGFQPAEA